MTMTEQEKRELAREMLERNGYSEKEIEKILRLTYGEKADSKKKSGGKNAP